MQQNPFWTSRLQLDARNAPRLSLSSLLFSSSPSVAEGRPDLRVAESRFREKSDTSRMYVRQVIKRHNETPELDCRSVLDPMFRNTRFGFKLSMEIYFLLKDWDWNLFQSSNNRFGVFYRSLNFAGTFMQIRTFSESEGERLRGYLHYDYAIKEWWSIFGYTLKVHDKT